MTAFPIGTHTTVGQVVNPGQETSSPRWSDTGGGRLRGPPIVSMETAEHRRDAQNDAIISTSLSGTKWGEISSHCHGHTQPLLEESK